MLRSSELFPQRSSPRSSPVAWAPSDRSSFESKQRRRLVATIRDKKESNGTSQPEIRQKCSRGTFGQLDILHIEGVAREWWDPRPQFWLRDRWGQSPCSYYLVWAGAGELKWSVFLSLFTFLRRLMLSNDRSFDDEDIRGLRRCGRPELWSQLEISSSGLLWRFTSWATLLSKVVFLIYLWHIALDVTANYICEIHCLAQDGISILFSN